MKGVEGARTGMAAVVDGVVRPGGMWTRMVDEERV